MTQKSDRAEAAPSSPELTDERWRLLQGWMSRTNQRLDDLAQQIQGLGQEATTNADALLNLRQRIAEVRVGQMSQASLRFPNTSSSPIHQALLDDVKVVRTSPLRRPPEYCNLKPHSGTGWLYQASVLYLMSRRGLTSEAEIDYLVTLAAGNVRRAARRAIDALEEYGLSDVLRRKNLKRGPGGYGGHSEDRYLSDDWDDLEQQRTAEIESSGLILRRTYPLWPVRSRHLRITLLRLTEAGKALCRQLGWEPVLNEWDHLIADHRGKEYISHTAAVIMVAVQARQRGFATTLLPGVLSDTQPDLLLERGKQRLYMEVELSDGRESLLPKWRNIERLQGFVAVCAKSQYRCREIVREIRALRLPYLATDIQSLYKSKFLDRHPGLPLFTEANHEWGAV